MATGQRRAKLLVAIIAGNPPDVSYIDRYVPCSYAAMGAIVPLDDMAQQCHLALDK